MTFWQLHIAFNDSLTGVCNTGASGKTREHDGK
jgi:hypothetical protein